MIIFIDDGGGGGGGGSGFPVFESSSSGGTATTSTTYTPSMPSGISAGDLLVMLLGNDGERTVTSAPSGWTLVDDEAVATDLQLRVYSKVAVGGDTFSITLSSVEHFAHICFRLSNASVIEAAIGAAATTGSPDAPNLAPTGGEQDYMWIAGFCTYGGVTMTAAPSGYANTINASAVSGGASVSVCAARKTSTASSDNPGAATASSSNPTMAFTIGIRA